MRKHSSLILVHGLFIFSFHLVFSQSFNSVILSNDANRTCHEQLIGSQSIGNIDFKNDGCTLICTILSSSTSDYLGYYDTSEERTILRSNIVCRNDEHVSSFFVRFIISAINFFIQICLNGSCIINPLLSSPSDPPSNISPSNISPPSNYGSLTVLIHKGYIKHDDVFSKGDIFIMLFVSEREIGRTGTVRDNHYPEYNKKFQGIPLSRHDVIKFEIWDEDSSGNEYIGSITTTCDRVIGDRINKKARSFYYNNHRLFITISCLGF